MKKLLTTLILITISITLSAQIFRTKEENALKLMDKYEAELDTTFINPIVHDTILWNGNYRVQVTHLEIKVKKEFTSEGFRAWLNERIRNKCYIDSITTDEYFHDNDFIIDWNN